METLYTTLGFFALTGFFIWRHLRRSQCGIQDDDIVVGLMPGSRRQELKNLFPIQLEAAATGQHRAEPVQRIGPHILLDPERGLGVPHGHD